MRQARARQAPWLPVRSHSRSLSLSCLVMGRRLGRRRFAGLELVFILAPQNEQHREQSDKRCEPTYKGTDIIPLHVQPWIERVIRQAIDGGTIDQEVEGIQLGITLASGITI